MNRKAMALTIGTSLALVALLIPSASAGPGHWTCSENPPETGYKYSCTAESFNDSMTTFCMVTWQSDSFDGSWEDDDDSASFGDCVDIRALLDNVTQ